MKRLQTLFTLLVLLLPIQSVSSQSMVRLGQPLQVLSPDSVFFLGEGIANLRLTPMLVDKTLQPSSFGADPGLFEQVSNRWCTKIAPTLNAVGGSGDEREDQTMAAVLNAADAAYMLRLTADARYADIVERAVFNALPRTFFMPAAPLDRSMAAQAIFASADLVYLIDSEGVYVNFYVPSMACITAGRFSCRLEQITSQPFSSEVKLRFSRLPCGGQTFAVRLRLPEWCVGQPEVFVNGREVDGCDVSHGYLIINRTWREGDEIYFSLPVAPAFVTVGDRRVLRCGPLVYALTDDVPVEAEIRVEGMALDETSGFTLVNLCMPSSASADTLSAARPFLIAPDGACVLSFPSGASR